MSSKKQQHVFVVMGATGEYSDRCEWPVCAYRDEDQAKVKVVRCTQRVKELQALRPDQLSWEVSPEYKNEDPNLRVDSTYYIMTVDLA